MKTHLTSFWTSWSLLVLVAILACASPLEIVQSAVTTAVSVTPTRGSSGATQIQPGGTRVSADKATKWTGTINYLSDDKVVGRQCTNHTIESLQGEITCTGSDPQSMKCATTGKASFSMDDELPFAQTYRKGSGDYAGVMFSTGFEIYPDEPGKPWSYLFDLVAKVPYTYEGVNSALTKVSGKDNWVITASPDIQMFDPNSGVIVFDKDLPLKKATSVSCQNPQGSGTHHLNLGLVAGR